VIRIEGNVLFHLHLVDRLEYLESMSCADNTKLFKLFMRDDDEYFARDSFVWFVLFSVSSCPDLKGGTYLRTRLHIFHIPDLNSQ
jgi:hypothetical protein